MRKKTNGKIFIDIEEITFENVVCLEVKKAGVTIAVYSGNMRAGKLIAGNICVLPQWRRKGVATTMYNYLQKRYELRRSDEETELGILFADKYFGEQCN